MDFSSFPFSGRAAAVRGRDVKMFRAVELLRRQVVPGTSHSYV